LSDDILLDRDGYVATITLNSPERLNSLSSDTHRMLGEAWDELKGDDTVRAVIVTGAGRAFCAGADMGMLNSLAVPDHRPINRSFTARRREFYKPVIVAVNGVCAGAGFLFVNDSDIVIASDRASFLDTHVNIGQVAVFEPIGMLRRMNLERVLRMVILGREERLTAEMALDVGLVSEVVPHDQLMNRARELAEIASRGSPATMQASLRAIWEAYEYTLSETYTRGYETLVNHRTSHPDAAEGTAAFIEGRDPIWTVP
jgi:enoyl-CoA hydratase/carnithine racemase